MRQEVRTFNRLVIIALVFAAAVASVFAYGVLVGRYQIFPYRYLVLAKNLNTSPQGSNAKIDEQLVVTTFVPLSTLCWMRSRISTIVAQ